VDTWDDVIEGIKLLVESDVDFYVTYICTKQNWKNVPQFLSLMKSLGVKKVNLHNLLPHFETHKDGEFWDLVLQESDQALIDLVKNLPDSDIVARWPVLIKKGETRRDCFFAWKQVGLDGNGYISCCNSVAPPMKENGRINDAGVWHNEYCEDLRWSILGEQKEMCKRCFRNWKCD
jgi:sulfatase maturation enzyme AslB (radical SAM superfamily)